MAYHPGMADADLILHDGDKFEVKNLMRQMCQTADAKHATGKAQMMAFDAEPFLGKGSVSFHDDYINGIEPVTEWMWRMNRELKEDEVALMIMCLDNDMTRKIIYDGIDEVQEPNVFVLDPANDYWTGHVNLWCRIAGNEPFLHPREKYEQLKKPKDRVPGAGCIKEAEATPQLITANKMAATITLQMVVAMLENLPLCEEIAFDLKKQAVTPIGEWVTT